MKMRGPLFGLLRSLNMAKNTVKVLIIDDCADIKELIEEYLTNSNNVEFLIDYKENFEANKINMPYDIYIIDDMFSGTSMSVQIAKKIREKDQSGRIFILSGAAKDNTLKQLINMKVDGFIAKDDLDVSPILKSAESIIAFRDQIDRLNSKISRLLSM